MGFKFGLETVLKHRKRLEELAQKEFVEARRELDACLGRIERMYSRMDEVRAEIGSAQSVGSKHKLHEIREMEHFISGQTVRIKTERLEARRLMQIAEEKQELLIEASREKKIMVKLKEKKLSEYREHLARLEAKEQDDMTTTRFGWETL